MRRNLSLFIGYLAIFLLSACGAIRELKVGDAVWAQWTPGLWYHGRIEAECERGFKIRFDAQDEKCCVPQEVAKDVTPTRTALQSGMQVLAPNADGTYTRAQVLAEDGWKFAVQFSDGGKSEFSLKDLRLPFSGPR